MEYMYIKETDEMFVLFHGTGGNENSANVGNTARKADGFI